MWAPSNKNLKDFFRGNPCFQGLLHCVATCVAHFKIKRTRLLMEFSQKCHYRPQMILEIMRGLLCRKAPSSCLHFFISLSCWLQEIFKAISLFSCIMMPFFKNRLIEVPALYLSCIFMHIFSLSFVRHQMMQPEK